MAKQRKVATLQQVAEEMNEVMAYGCNEKGELVDPAEQIDTDLSDKALMRVLKDRAKEDLRAGDEGSFSPEVWDWFVDNNLAPDPNTDVDVDMDEGDDRPVDDGTESEDPDSDDQDDSDQDEEPEQPRQAPPAKMKRDTNPNKADKPQKGDSKARKTEKRPDTHAEDKKSQKSEERADNPDSNKKSKRTGSRPTVMAKGGNEGFAIELVKKGADFPEFYQEYVDLYKEYKPEADKKFVLSRAKIYWNIAHKKLGRTTPPAELDNDKPAKQDKKSRKDDADTGRSARRNRK